MIGVSPRGQNALQFGSWQTGKSTGLAHFRRHGLDHAKRAIGLAKFRAYMLQTQP